MTEDVPENYLNENDNYFNFHILSSSSNLQKHTNNVEHALMKSTASKHVLAKF
jgi:hypothetical protein